MLKYLPLVALVLMIPATIQESPRHATFDRTLMKQLELLSTGLDREILLCLHGRVEGTRIILTHFKMTEPLISKPGQVRFSPCPDETLAEFHNHLEHCGLSSQDMRAVISAGRKLEVVGTKTGYICWWNQAQVREVQRLNRRVGVPISGQYTTFQKLLEEDDG